MDLVHLQLCEMTKIYSRAIEYCNYALCDAYVK